MTEMKKEDMNIVIVGHVDHGKSTLMGRLLADTDSLPQGKLEQVKEICRRNSKPFEYAFLLDALKDEQAQGITIDTARCFFKTKKRDYIILDAPGHIEFLKNMITGAARAEAAILVIDAKEGIQENSRRHGYMLSMLGIKQIAVAINKMDLVDYSEEVYERVKAEYIEFLHQIHIEPMVVLPVSAFHGDNIVSTSTKMPWYKGTNILEVLDSFQCEKSQDEQVFRMPVQDVYKFTKNGDNRRIVAGTVDTGCAAVGDRVVFLPSGKHSTIKSIERFSAPVSTSVGAGSAVGFTLEEQIYVKRGELMVLEKETQPIVSNCIAANVFWLGKEALVPNKNYFLKIGSEKVGVKLIQVLNTMNSSNLSSEKKDYVGKNEVAECIFQTARPIAFDTVDQIAATSRFVLIDRYEICGGGIILRAAEEDTQELQISSTEPNIVWQTRKVTYEERCSVLGQKGLVVWFTGLSGAGKSTIAIEVEKRLNDKGRAAYLLDGDNIRHGINADLGFTDQDRNENIRRIAEVATLFQDAGMITLVSFISPFTKMRQYARDRVGTDNFIEVYVQADLETCRSRDPKGLYKKQIENFTGISSPYEPPKHAQLVLDTEQLSIEESVELVMDIIEDWLNK